MRLGRSSIFMSASLTAFAALSVLSFVMVQRSRVTAGMAEECGFPLVFVETRGGKMVKSKESYQNATCQVGRNGEKFECKIRGRGNSTWKQPKKPYLVKFGEETEFLGMPRARKWALLSNGTDNTSLRNAYATMLATEFFSRQDFVPQYRFVSLFLNGQYEGLYQVYEKPGDWKNRDGGADGWQVVANTHNRGRNQFETKRCQTKFTFKNPKFPDELKAAEIRAFVDSIEDALLGGDFTDPEGGWRRLMDEDTLIDWYWVNELTTNRDARMKNSVYLTYRTDDGKVRWGPIWDFDISCGNNDYPANTTTEGYWIRENSEWFSRLFEDDSFRKRAEERWREVSPGLLGRTAEWISDTSGRLEAAKLYDDRVWRTIGRYQWPHATGWQKRRTYRAEVEYMAKWLERRIAWLDGDIGESR